jgi:hypothetical protein
VTEECIKLHNEELNDMYCSPNIVRVIKSRMRCLNVSRLRERCIQGFGGETRRDHFEDPGLDGSIILRGIFRKWKIGAWTGSSFLRIGTVGGHVTR